jgi:hypothetical protein
VCRKLAIVTISVLLLAATVAISFVITEDAFARERYSGDSTSQAAAVSNECLNPILDSNEDIDNVVGVGNCGGTVSQQDESGSAVAPITSQTANPTIELQRSTTSQPVTGEQDPVTTCVNCFNGLTDAQQAGFEAQIPMATDPSITTIEEMCDYMNRHPEFAAGLVVSIQNILQDVVVEPDIYNPIITCVENAFNLG